MVQVTPWRRNHKHNSPHAARPCDGRCGETADTEVVGVGRLHAFVDTVADTHTLSLERPVCHVTAATAADLVRAVAPAADARQTTDEADAALGQRRRRVGPVRVGPDDRPRHEGRRAGARDGNRPAGHREGSGLRVERRVGRLRSKHVITIHVLATKQTQRREAISEKIFKAA